MSADTHARAEFERPRSEDLEYLEDTDRGQYNTSMASSHGTYMMDKDNLEDARSSCDWCEAVERLDGRMTDVRAREF